MEKASFFDWDGTLTDIKKVFLMNSFSEHLVSKGLFPRKGYLQIEDLRHLYGQGKISYREAAGGIPSVYASFLKGVRIIDLQREATNFADKVIKEYAYPYTRDLITLMGEYGMTIAISGAPEEVVMALGKNIGFDLSYGTILQSKNGVCTGSIKQNLVLKETKEAIVSKIIKENSINLEKSYAFGDTAEDTPLLSKVENPVALNPNRELLAIAKKNRWMTLYSDEDVVNKINERIKHGR
jgi:HAD superfamily hydrolase (TIGR01490 family)